MVLFCPLTDIQKEIYVDLIDDDHAIDALGMFQGVLSLQIHVSGSFGD